ncbi:MAG: LLM class F420-dependent oxidoreductase [Acidimicrobiia bacterium]
MKIAIQHSSGDPKWVSGILHPKAVTRWARAAEESGFDALGFTDHPAPSSRWINSGGEGVCDPFTALGFCAAVTERIKLMTFVAVAGYRNPLMFAQQLATLDVLSDGRVIAGLGTGYLKSEFHALGVDPNRRTELLDEAIEVMRLGWSGAEITMDTKTFSANQAMVRPPTIQGVDIPIWIHANSKWGTERAVKHAQGWMGMIMDPERTRTVRTPAIVDFDHMGRRIAELDEECEKHGRDRSTLEVIVNGMWGWLDIRDGLDIPRMREEMELLESMGVDWVVGLATGADVGAAEDTVRALGEGLKSN